VTCTLRAKADLQRAAILFIDLSTPPEPKRSYPEAEILPHETKSDWKRITLLRKTSCKKEIKNIGR
jgi:hypothetical protein